MTQAPHLSRAGPDSLFCSCLSSGFLLVLARTLSTMASIEYHRLHAFTSPSFGTGRFGSGNPAAVFVRDPTVPSPSLEVLQQLATEADLPNTAVIAPLPSTDADEDVPTYSADYYSRKSRIPLCGHATLCAAQIIFETSLSAQKVRFETALAGIVFAEKQEDGRIAIDFPANHDGFRDVGREDERWEKTVKAVLKAAPSLTREDVVNVAWVPLGPIVELKTEVDLKKLEVDVSEFPALSPKMVIFTQVAPSSAPSDIQSRVFAPAMGSAEDPVCGSAHCSVTPYFLGNPTARARLSALHPRLANEEETTLHIVHSSARGGEMEATWDRTAGRMRLVGGVVKVVSGRVFL
ncbi:hypothetical protein BCR35DRAFT_301809 [Leucosporidium creatinivorum]|uniref:Diaminopimelate epimerase-like protein n=1 Tax=Leucosporidium creatinivorum TaxID=106004 RepID=A0A1Y2FW80_9BASI|nr:hypothetical protein BCR35DRAFT_301809 [Leucosporidium creatinivorum]